MICRRVLYALLIVLLGGGEAWVKADAQVVTAPDANAPATQPASITPDARKLVDQMADAYLKLKTLDVAGTLSKDFDINGDNQKMNATFTGAYAAPNKFRHTMNDGDEQITWGSTGTKAYAFQKSANVFVTSDVDAGRLATEDLPDPLGQLAPGQDPSIQYAAAKDPAAEIIRNAASVTRGKDANLDGKSYQTLQLDLNNKRNVTLLVDPQTHLLRQMRVDLKAMLEDQGTPGVKQAVVTVDYSKVAADSPVPDESFAWKPPEGAHEQTADDPTSPLLGKTAPAFTLDELNGGGHVTLSALKGNVVVLDFWATSCPACLEAMPHLNKLYEENKANGAKVFAVNCNEDKSDVEKFVQKTKLTVPVLLATSDQTMQDYGADAIPMTVIIGKDGKVARVFIGYGGSSFGRQIDAAVSAALAK